MGHNKKYRNTFDEFFLTGIPGLKITRWNIVIAQNSNLQPELNRIIVKIIKLAGKVVSVLENLCTFVIIHEGGRG